MKSQPRNSSFLVARSSRGSQNFRAGAVGVDAVMAQFIASHAVSKRGGVVTDVVCRLRSDHTRTRPSALLKACKLSTPQKHPHTIGACAHCPLASFVPEVYGGTSLAGLPEACDVAQKWTHACGSHISGPVVPTVPFWNNMAMMANIARRPFASSAFSFFLRISGSAIDGALGMPYGPNV